MSLFPALLLGVSLLGLVGQYPATCDAIMGYLREVAPRSALAPLDSSLRGALQRTSTVLRRRGLRPLCTSKATFNARSLASSMPVVPYSAITTPTSFGFAGLGPQVADAWNVVRWPAAVAVAVLVFAFVYYVTPDVRQRSFRRIAPGAVVAVALWLLASWGFATYISRVADVGAIYGAFAGAIVLVGWIWLTNVALLFGAEVNASIEHRKRIVHATRPRPPG